MNQEKTTKSGAYLCQMFNAIVLAGIIMFFTGAYYCVIKAGIPYQDPPPELQIQYAIHMGIGEILVKDGFLFFTGGGILRLLLQLILKKTQKK